MNFLAMDLGGTTAKYAMSNEKGVILHEGKFFTASQNADELLDKILKLSHDFHQKYCIQGIGVSCAGIVHPHTGQMLGSSFNMPKGWHKAEVKAYLNSRLDMPVVVENDVNSAALAELWLGAGRNLHTFICLAMGTGIGSGIIIDKKLYYGANYRAGEIGYIHANKGATSYWERHASTLALVNRVKIAFEMNRRAKEEIDVIDGKYIFDLINSDSLIKNIVDDWADILARGIADAAYILNPQAVILGGGISEQGPMLLELLQPKIDVYCAPGFTTNIKIAELGNHAGKLGVVKRLLDEYFTMV
ncbi:glucokinase [Brevinema andersonii]|uniref:Glucokinase n=1 Tax=Brevinema andersonii TaxID=34097 RepID=A0A1I1E6J7_BREAD|nr:ROK family protein [Brevinema andersonii]SFB82781.1 glucokinase [Brevinema andersonii]